MAGLFFHKKKTPYLERLFKLEDAILEEWHVIR